MISLFHAFGSTLLSTAKSSSSGLLFPSWKTSVKNPSIRLVNLEAFLTRIRVQCYSVKKSRKKNRDLKSVMKDDKEAFFVVRKGDLIGVYKSLSDCQAQVGTSICDPPVSVFKGYSMPKDTEKYLLSCGLKNSLYSIRAADLTQELFGTLVSCPIQPSSSGGETSIEPLALAKKRPQEALWSDYGETVASLSNSTDALKKQRVDTNPSVCNSCTLEFDGSSKGNPGRAGAGAIVRSDDGSLICRLREGLGIATNNVAEYRGFILGLRYALGKGFTSVRVRGDSKLVCMQIQGLWRVKNQNISFVFDEAKKLKDKFHSFQIMHVLRDLNSEADVQANLAVELAEGQVHEVIDK